MLPRLRLLRRAGAVALVLATLVACSPAKVSPPPDGDVLPLVQPQEEPVGSGLSGLRAGEPDPRGAAATAAPKSMEEIARRAEAQAGIGQAAPGRTNQAPRSDRAPQGPVSSQPAPPGPDESTVQLPIIQNLGRMVIYTTQMILLTGDLDTFPAEVGTIALAHGGYVAGVETKEESGVPAIVVQVKVPPAEYEAVMRSLRSLAVEVRDERATTKDVSEEYSDVGAQIASLEAAHAQLLLLMERSGSMEEILKVQREANRVKLQIDRLKGRQTAIERLSEFATITAKALLASAALQRDYTSVRSALRRADATRASLELQLKRARTPEEEATIRDKLGEALLEITRLQGRLGDLESKAAAARVTLPTSETATVGGRLDETLPKDYIDTRVALRRAQWEQAELTRAIRAGRPDADAKALAETILKVNRLAAELRDIQQRAAQAGVTLPPLSPEDEAVLAGVAPIAPGGFEVPASIRHAWDLSIGFLLTVVGALVFLWWLLPLGAVALFVLRRRTSTASMQESATVEAS